VLAPLVAMAQGSSAGLYSIRINGLEVAAVPSLTYGVDPASIEIVEAAPGDVSSCHFVIDDTLSAISVAGGEFVVVWDLGFDVPLFAGWIDTYEATTFGLGRSIAIACVGVETVIDWMYVPTFTIPAGTDILPGLQQVAAAALGVGFALNTAGSNGGTSTIASPIACGAGGTSVDPFVVPAGTLRQALAAWGNAWLNQNAFFGLTGTAGYVASVDYYGGLRVVQDYTALAPPLRYWQDSAPITVTTAADPRPSGTRYRVGAAAARAAIASNGAGALTPVSDGSGIPGAFVTVSSTTATTVDRRTSLGASALAAQGPTLSGETTIAMTRALCATKGVGSSSARRGVGSALTLTDAAVGASALATIARKITKTFADSGEETWTIAYGGALRQSGTALIRKLTSGTFA
jgi:hypothetical protein